MTAAASAARMRGTAIAKVILLCGVASVICCSMSTAPAIGTKYPMAGAVENSVGALVPLDEEDDSSYDDESHYDDQDEASSCHGVLLTVVSWVFLSDWLSEGYFSVSSKA